jgi:hypothetical protein
MRDIKAAVLIAAAALIVTACQSEPAEDAADNGIAGEEANAMPPMDMVPADENAVAADEATTTGSMMDVGAAADEGQAAGARPIPDPPPAQPE